MFTKILPRKTQETVQLLGASGIIKTFYLSGGTACALYLGHRISKDLDFFTKKEFSVKELGDALRMQGSLEPLSEDKNTFHCIFNKTRLSFLRYPYPLLKPGNQLKAVTVSSLLDVLCTKLDTVSARGSKKDFIDLYCAVQKKMYTLEEIITKSSQNQLFL